MKKSKTNAKKGLTSLPIIDLGETNALKPWKAGPYESCAICGKGGIYYTQTAQAGTVCQACCTAAIEKELIASKANIWPRERIKNALSPRAAIVERLAVLTHIHPIQLEVDIRDLLIENMGFVSAHPLAHKVRQKAFEACISYHNPRQMFDKILKKQPFINWQQKVNITKACYHISPNHPDTIAKFEMTARDPSPSARTDIASFINQINKPWARKLWQDLCRDPNPLVREGCEQIAAEQNQQVYRQAPLDRLPKIEKISDKSTAPQNTKKAYTPFEQTVKNGINFRTYAYQKINSQYLSEMRYFIDPNTYGHKEYDELQGNTQSTCIRLIAATLSSKYVFKGLLAKLPAEVGILIYLCTWENQFFFTKDDLKRIATLRKTGKDKQGKFPELPASFLPLLGKPFPSHTQWDVEVIQNPAFFLFEIERTWNGRSSTAGYRVNIHKDFIPHLKKILPLPELFDVTPVPDVSLAPESYTVYEEKRFFEQLPTILAFIAQDNLEFTKNGDKVKVASLKKMSTLCTLNEFYEGGQHSSLKYLKSTSLADFFISGAQWKGEVLDNLPLFLKNKIKQYLEFTDYKALRCRDFLKHVKRQKPEYDSAKIEKEIRQSFKTLLTLLPKGKWVAVEHIVQAICYRGLATNPFSNPVEISYVCLDLSPKTIKRFSLLPDPGYYYGGRIDVSKTNTVHTIALPLMKALLFFFGSLNMVSLAYCEPENDRYHLTDKPYLSIYDGLTYVRLTDFGAFVLDKEKSFSADIEKQSAEIILDETRTLLSLLGEDPVKRLALESVGKRVTTSSYLVDYQSFLKDCSGQNEVQNKIDYFRTHISKNPPEIWETFFQSVLARMEPLKIVKDMYILKVSPDKELIALLTTDPVLKKHVIKAENYHLIVEKRHYPTVKKRLAQFGFF
ncbi:MAG: hypothetical protein QM498_07235 [Desulfobacterium sp.]